MDIDKKPQTEQEQIPKYEEQVENLALSYLETGRSFDIVHTEYGLEVLKENKGELDEDIYKILFFSFALHDIGYSLLDEAPEGYENIKKQKQAHAILGSKEAKNILSSETYSNTLNDEERETIYELILHHDEVDSVVDYTYKDFEIGRYLMSLDTLGAFLAIQDGKATFEKDELKNYLKKNIERRGGRIHEMLRERLKQTLEEINTNFTF